MDLTVLATDRGSVPMNIGAVIEFEAGGGPSLPALRDLLSERVPTIPRLRQRLRRVPFGCGRPVWVDDPDFVLDRHLVERKWPTPGGDRQLLDVAAELMCQRLDTDRPLWRACLVTDSVGGQAALIVVLHHVLADGLGGLAILAALADPGLPAPTRTFPQRPPLRRDLAADAAREKVRAASTVPIRLRRGLAGLRELGLGPSRPRLIEKTSLNRPTSNRRRLATVTVPLADIVTAAHRAGGTVNDVVLAAVTGALITELRARGEHPARLVVSVPVSGRPSATADRLGNNTGVRPITVPTLADDNARLAEIISADPDQPAACPGVLGRPARAGVPGPQPARTVSDVHRTPAVSAHIRDQHAGSDRATVLRWTPSISRCARRGEPRQHRRRLRRAVLRRSSQRHPGHGS